MIEITELKPSVWRKIQVPADISFSKLHAVIQISMGWLDYHLYEFSFPGENILITENIETYEEYKFYRERFKGRDPLPEEDPTGKAGKILERTVKQPTAKIKSYFERNKTAKYLYDFGDRWEHKITLEEILEDLDPEQPCILAGEGSCPPEDVGGPTGYQFFLEAWSNPEHPEHGPMTIWGRRQFYGEFDIAHRNRLLKAYSRMEGKENAFIHPRTLLLGDGIGTFTSGAQDHIRLTGHVCPNKMLPCGTLGFNLTGLRTYCETHKEEIRQIEIEIKRWNSLYPCILDESRIGQADLDEPVLLVEITPECFEFDGSIDPESSIERNYLLIDGGCQMEKARRLGRKKIPACALSVEQHADYMVSGREGFVKYWNRELEYLP